MSCAPGPPPTAHSGPALLPVDGVAALTVDASLQIGVAGYPHPRPDHPGSGLPASRGLPLPMA
jgi:hypothetical protein